MYCASVLKRKEKMVNKRKRKSEESEETVKPDSEREDDGHAMDNWKKQRR
jgi:hypothetical protein